MTHLIVDEGLLDDMAACLNAFRQWCMQLAEEHPDMDTGAVDDLLRRYRVETGRRPPSVEDHR